jgi:hypothetical protein
LPPKDEPLKDVMSTTTATLAPAAGGEVG